MPNTREKLIELLKSGGVRDFPFNAALADHLIANGVTIPVRCKDCTRAENHGAEYEVYCNLICAYMENDDFCSYGERKDK